MLKRARNLLPSRATEYLQVWRTLLRDYTHNRHLTTPAPCNARVTNTAQHYPREHRPKTAFMRNINDITIIKELTIPPTTITVLLEKCLWTPLISYARLHYYSKVFNRTSTQFTATLKGRLPTINDSRVTVVTNRKTTSGPVKAS